MRMLLFFLLVLNILYAGWEYVSPSYRLAGVMPMADNLKSLQLLRETQQISSVEKPEKLALVLEEVDAQPVLEEIEKNNVSCYTLGPFKDKTILQQLSDSVSEYVDDIEVRTRQESEKHRYWVHVPALPTRAEAKKMAQKLRDGGVTDFYVVFKGTEKNSISLGHFREPNHANRRMTLLSGKGFNVEVNVIYRTYDLYWLDYQVDDASEFLVEEYMTAGVSRLDRECEISELSQ